MPPASRITDMHVCPMVTGIVPHVGGPILPPGVPTVLVGFLPAATVTNMCTCVGPPDIIVKGSAGVFINYLPAARMGDTTAHGGTIILGYPTVMIGETGGGGAGGGGAGAVGMGVTASSANRPDPGDETDANASEYSGAGAGSRADAPVDGGTDRQKAIVQGINPTNSTKNCGYNIDAANDRLTGKNPNATAPDQQDGSFDDIEKRFNTKMKWGSSLQDAYDAVQKGGNGTTAVVGVGYSGGGSHVFVMNNDHGTVGILEGQDWGPGNPKEVITDPAVANKRYNSDGKSNIGYGVIPPP